MARHAFQRVSEGGYVIQVTLKRTETRFNPSCPVLATPKREPQLKRDETRFNPLRLVVSVQKVAIANLRES
jgi:hypothetical protein